MCVCVWFVCYADDRLMSILYHHNFLKELQEIAAEGESQVTQSLFCLHLYEDKKNCKDGNLNNSFYFKVAKRELSGREMPVQST